MGFSFAAIRKELNKPYFTRAYESLRKECPELVKFRNCSSLIAFFHDRGADPDLKDSVLFELVRRYRQTEKYREIAPLFIALFTPAIARIYSFTKRIYPSIEGEDLAQELCLFLLQIVEESQISRFKVAGRIARELRNRVRTIIRRIPAGTLVPLENDDGMNKVEMISAPEADDRDAGDEFNADEIIHETIAFLDELISQRKITKRDKRIVIRTIIEGKPLNDVVPASDYDRMKHRRARILSLIKKHFAK